MAFIALAQATRARLSATKGVTVIASPCPRDPNVLALVIAGVRCVEINRDGEDFRTMWHVRMGKWIILADGVSEDVAFAATLAFVTLTSSIPQHYSAANDAAERAAAAEVAAAFTPGLSTLRREISAEGNSLKAYDPDNAKEPARRLDGI